MSRSYRARRGSESSPGKLGMRQPGSDVLKVYGNGKRRMGHTMGHNRKGGSRDSVDRPRRRNTKRWQGYPPSHKNSGDVRHRAARSYSLAGTEAPGKDETEAPRVSPAAGKARTVGHKRLWTVAAVFVVSGLLLGGRAVHISLTEDEDYRAFAAEQSWDGCPGRPTDSRQHRQRRRQGPRDEPRGRPRHRDPVPDRRPQKQRPGSCGP